MNADVNNLKDKFINLKPLLKKCAYNDFVCGFINDEEKTDIIRLRFRTLMLWYYKILTFFTTNNVYYYTKNNANLIDRNGEWVLMETFNILNKDNMQILNKLYGFYLNWREQWNSESADLERMVQNIQNK